MLFWLPHIPVRVGDNPAGPGVSFLRTSDVGSIITAALVVIRVITSSWSGLVVWRSIYLLMEKSDIDIRQINWMVTWKLLRPSTLGSALSTSHKNKTSSSSRTEHKHAKIYHIYVAEILILTWPATLSPILTSAVNWRSRVIETQEFYSLFDEVSGASSVVSIGWWDAYLNHDFVREMFLKLIFRRLKDLVKYRLPEENCRLYLPAVLKYDEAKKATERALTYPCIEIGDIRWTNPHENVSEVQESFGAEIYSEVFATTYNFYTGLLGHVQFTDTAKFPSWLSEKQRYLQLLYCGDF
jgi:hypothetical protein